MFPLLRGFLSILLFKDLVRKTGMGVPIPVLDLAAKNNKLLNLLHFIRGSAFLYCLGNIGR